MHSTTTAKANVVVKRLARLLGVKPSKDVLEDALLLQTSDRNDQILADLYAKLSTAPGIAQTLPMARFLVKEVDTHGVATASSDWRLRNDVIFAAEEYARAFADASDKLRFANAFATLATQSASEAMPFASLYRANQWSSRFMPRYYIDTRHYATCSPELFAQNIFVFAAKVAHDLADITADSETDPAYAVSNVIANFGSFTDGEFVHELLESAHPKLAIAYAEHVVHRGSTGTRAAITANWKSYRVACQDLCDEAIEVLRVLLPVFDGTPAEAVALAKSLAAVNATA